jgi:3-methyladenine DNA glycosylase AlkD
MNPQQLFDELYQFGIQHTDQARIEKYQRYFKEAYDAFGLNEGLLDMKIKELLKNPEVSIELALEASVLMVASPKYEMAAGAFKLLLAFKKSWDKRVFSTVESWFQVGITNWAHTDYLSGEITPLLISKKIIGIDDLKPWRESSFRFQRRASVVSLIKPMKKDSHFPPFFDFIEPMMHDPERVVHQALGWLLREMWKKQPQPVEEFLHRFKNTSPRLIFQYATEKMTKEGKENFRKEKKQTTK